MTGKSPRLHFVVPLFNEAENLPRLMESLREQVQLRATAFETRLVLVDDGSTDRTAERARELGAGLDMRILRLERNSGPGRAFAQAFHHLHGQCSADDWVVTLEGDNTSRQELLSQMLTRAAEGYDAILASPYVFGGSILNTARGRVFVSYVANVFLKEALGLQGIFTMSSFFRLYRGDLLRRLQDTYGPSIVERPGFECMVELLIKMISIGARISEVPMVLDTSLRAGRSKMSVSRTTVGYLTLWRDARRWRRVASAASF